jgi:transcriptional regulator with XRE-family HTH domain
MSMTLEVLASRSGLTPNYIGGVEMGKRDPSLSTVLALAMGLGVRPAELFSSSSELAPAAEEMGRLFELTVPEVQEAVLKILRTQGKASKGQRK